MREALANLVDAVVPYDLLESGNPDHERKIEADYRRALARARALLAKIDGDAGAPGGTT